MQIPKEEIRVSILAVAREEFLTNGYESASIRTITAKAKTSKSNLYHYYKDKDSLFYAVVKPTVAGTHAFFAQLKEGNKQRKVQGYTIDSQRQIMIAFMGLIFDHSEDFRLLFFRSGGSSLSDFRTGLVESLADVLGNWVDVIAPSLGLSKIFLTSVADFYIGTIQQLLAMDKTKAQVGAHMNEFLLFVYGGWKNVLAQQQS